jgi:hypothetical protein
MAATQLETFTAGAETAVDVAQVERQLRDLWQLASQDAHQRITRACLFNLVAYCESTADRDRISAILGEVTSRHPCRAIVLLAQPRGPAHAIAASITAHCHLAGGGKQVWARSCPCWNPICRRCYGGPAIFSNNAPSFTGSVPFPTGSSSTVPHGGP